jgi:hypothetical protein
MARSETAPQVYTLTENTDSCMKRRLDGLREKQEKSKKDWGGGEGCCFGYRLSQNWAAGDVRTEAFRNTCLKHQGNYDE